MKNLLLASIALCALISGAEAQTRPEWNLMPMPASLQSGEGQLAVGQSFSVGISGHSNARVQHAAQRLIARLSTQTGLPLSPKIADSGSATLTLNAAKAGESVQKLGEDESYTLEVTAKYATITAPTDLGVLRGIETFLQLVQAGKTGYVVPAVTIRDQPRFAWRGLMIDTSRHFQPIEVIKRNLDAMAAVKMNVFHWHLSDNQGFRFESKRFPKLQEMGSNGFYYTQDQIRDVLAYAYDRGIRIVPEIDIPGHDTAMFVGYPELSSGPGPYEIEKHFGIFDPAMDPSREETFKFVDKLVGEMTALFPDQFFHIGGDEVNGRQWKANPKIQEFMRAHNLKTSADLQAYFTNRAQQIVKKHHKTMIGWDEVQHPDIPSDVVIQSWRGAKGLANAAHAGYRSILSYGYYIDLLFPASQHYANDPLTGPAADLTPEQQKLVMGGEATMWAEHVTSENIDSRIWPRTAAIAERLWSPQNVNDVDSMYRRLAFVNHYLDWVGTTQNSYYQPVLERIAGPENVQNLATLASVLEPPKSYTREQLDQHRNTTETAYVRLVDVLPPESDTAREFAQLVNRVLGGQASAEDKAHIRSLLVGLRENDKRLRPAFESGSFLQMEIAPVSKMTADLAGAGLQALDYVDSGVVPSAEWTQQQLSITQQGKKPHATTLIMIAEPIELLVKAASGTATNTTK